MKYALLLPAVLLCVLCVSCDNNKYRDVENAPGAYAIIPKPSHITPLKGAFLIDKNTSIRADDGLDFEADYLKNTLEKFASIKIGNRKKAGILLLTDDSIEEDEGYTLDVTPNAITVKGRNSSGIFHGIQTLVQLIATIGNDKVVPCVQIHDSPRFAYRGMHLDVGRHFFDVDFVKKYIDLIALHKMNKFHWHLTEDQGWRIEIKKYPKLTEVGSTRNGTIIGHFPGKKNDNETYRGFYTQEEIRDVVAYAALRHITVIPEIELPGHSSAAIASYPSLSCFPDEVTRVPNDAMSQKSKDEIKSGRKKIVQESWGIFKDVYFPSEETFAFLEDVLSEVIDLFPSKYIHIGGDECMKDNWKRSKSCQSIIEKHNLKDVYSLQSYFISRIERFLNSKGRNIIGWDEILEGGLTPNATVMSWRGEDGGIEAAKQHHDVIMTPGSHCYFDHYQSKPVENEPLAIGGYTPVEKVYGYEPIPEELSEDEHRYVLGAQGNVWTEYMKDPSKVEYMILPRMTALSEVLWTEKQGKDWEDFVKRLNHMRTIYDALKLNYAKHLFDK